MKDTLGCRVGAIYLKGTSESHVEGHLKGIPFYYWSNRTVRAQNLLNQSHPIQIQKVQIKGSEPARLCWIINMSKRSYSPFHKPLTRRFTAMNTCSHPPHQSCWMQLFIAVKHRASWRLWKGLYYLISAGASVRSFAGTLVNQCYSHTHT